MGCARKLVFSWGGNPGVGSLHRFRDAVEHGWPAPLELEEHSHAGMAAAYAAGAANLPFGVFAATWGPSSPSWTQVAAVECPFTGERLAAVRALRPDVGIVHAQQADEHGQRSALGHQRRPEGDGARRARVARHRRGDRPRAHAAAGRRRVPGWAVTAVSVAPGGAHPSYAHGYYDRDNAFYVGWDAISRDRERFGAWMQRHVLDAPVTTV